MKQHGSLITSGSVHIRAAAMHAPEDMRVDLDMPEGSTVAEIVAAALPGASNAELTHARVTLVNKGSMAVIERGLWHRVRPHAGTSVVIRIVPQGDKLKGILSVVVAIAALAIGIYLAPVLAAAGTFGITNAATWQAIIGRGVTLIGTLAINALIPPPSTSSDTPKPNYAISGWRNNLTPDGIVPSVMGKHRYAPPFAMTPYIEIIDGTQYINAAFCFGYGPLELSDHRIGETPLSDFTDYEMQIRSGFAGDNPLTMFPDQVIEEAIGTELVHPLPRDDQGEVIEGEPGIDTPVIRTLARDATRAAVILLFPQGMVKISDDGDEKSILVEVRIRSRPVGDTTWTFEKLLIIGAKTRDPFYRQFTWDLSPRGLYEVEVTPMRDESVNPQRMDRVQLVAIQSFRPEYPLNFDAPLALVALRIKASYQLNGALDTYNAVASRITQDWDHVEEEWSSGETRNPASLFRLVLQGKANAKPLGNDQIDLAALADWHGFCRVKGLRYDRVHDFEAGLLDTLTVIAAAGRASPRFDGRKWSVVIDRPQNVVVDHINPRNSYQLRWDRNYFEPPHAFRIPFLDRTNNFQSAERLVRWPGYSGDITVTEQIDLPGKTDPDEIYIEARRRMYELQYRPDSVQVIQEGAARVATRGDLVMVNYDVLARLQKAARVKSVDGELVEIDDIVTMTGSQTYGIRFRRYPDGDTIGESVVREVMTVAGEQTLLRVLDASRMPAEGEVIHFGPLASESEAMIVKSVEPGEDMTSVFTLIAPSDLIDEFTDDEVPPTWSGRVGSELEDDPTEPAVPVIKRVLHGAGGTDSVDGLTVLVEAGRTGTVRTREIEIDHRIVGAGSWTTTTIDAADGGAEIDDYVNGDAVEIRARGLSGAGTPGPYTSIVDVTI